MTRFCVETIFTNGFPMVAFEILTFAWGVAIRNCRSCTFIVIKDGGGR